MAAAAARKIVNLVVLNNVLFPGATTTIPIFEPKYRIMVSEILQNDEKTFGYVKALPNLNNKKGGNPPYQSASKSSTTSSSSTSTSSSSSSSSSLRTDWNGEDTGTLAKIVKHDYQSANSAYLLDLVGTERFRIVSKERTIYGSYVGTIEILKNEEEMDSEIEKTKDLALEAKRLYQQCFDKIQAFKNGLQTLESLSEPTRSGHELASFSFQLAELLPVSELDKQRMLSTDSVSKRLEIQTLVLKGFLENHSVKNV